MASQYDCSRKDIVFKVSYLVYLNASDLKKPPGLAHKLLPHFWRLFKILKHPSPLNYHLDLPPKSHAHDVFHVEKLLPAYGCDWLLFPTPNEPVPNNDPVTDNLGDYYEEEYDVEKLVAHHYNSKGELQYKVWWLEYPGQDTWQSLEDISTAPEAIQNFWQSLSHVEQTKHDAIMKWMIDNAPEGSILKSGNVTEKFISVLFSHVRHKI